MIFPPPLRPGDRVVMLSPSGSIERPLLTGARRRLESWGLHVDLAAHAANRRASFAGSVAQRLGDLQAAMDDPDVRAIFCSRGGYGAVHLVDSLDFTAFARHPKWLMGYSDITALHSAFQAHGFASVHSLMAKHLTEEPADDYPVACLRSILFGESTEGDGTLTYLSPRHKLDVKGTCQGTLRGGNLSVFYGLRGTRFDIPAEGTLLFIEDVNERPHAVERMLYNLKIGGILPRLSGLIVGQFTEYTETGSLYKDLYGSIHDLVKDYGYPVAFDFPVGHVKRNLPLVCGATASLEVGKKVKKLTFPLR